MSESLKIKQTDAISLGCTIEYNGQAIDVTELEFKMIAGEIPKVRFTVPISSLDVEFEKVFPTSEELVEFENILFNQDDIIIVRYPQKMLFSVDIKKAQEAFEQLFEGHKVIMIPDTIEIGVLPIGMLKTHKVSS